MGSCSQFSLNNALNPLFMHAEITKLPWAILRKSRVSSPVKVELW